MPFGERAESIPENFFWQAVLVRAFQDATAEGAHRATAAASWQERGEAGRSGLATL